MSLYILISFNNMKRYIYRQHIKYNSTTSITDLKHYNRYNMYNLAPITWYNLPVL